MQAMVLEKPGEPLVLVERPDPEPSAGESSSGLPLAASAAPICMSSTASFPIRSCRSFPATRSSAASKPSARASTASRVGMRVGIPWLGHTCGVAPIAARGRENLCDRPLFTGYTRDGGYATHVVADARFVLSRCADADDDVAIAPLLCAGLIGWRVAAHRRRGRKRSASTASARPRISSPRSRAGRGARCSPSRGRATRGARRSRARSAPSGPADPTSRRPSRSTAPSSSRRSARWFPRRCSAVRKGGRVVCAGIHMSDIPSFPYELAVGGAELVVGCQSDAERRRGVFRSRAEGRHRHRDHRLCPGTCQ